MPVAFLFALARVATALGRVGLALGRGAAAAGRAGGRALGPLGRYFGNRGIGGGGGTSVVGVDVRVEVHGHKELMRALKRTQADLHKDIRALELEIARDVVAGAREIVISKDLVDSGDLLNGIRPFATQKGVGIRSGATHGGYAYPKRLEYEGRRGGKYGPRATLNPAVDRKEPEINRGIERVLDHLEKNWERG